MEQKPQVQISNIEEIRKMVMQDNANGNRLKTLRLPRDLTLGGTKIKKVFTPNLNVIRRKDRGKCINESVKSERHPKRLPNHSSRHSHKKQQLLQSEGIFSQGIGEGIRPNFSSERVSLYTGRANGNSTASLTVPTITRNRQSINKHNEKLIVESLLADDDSDSDSDVDDYSAITLPLQFPGNTKQGSQIIPNNIKKEILDEDCAQPHLSNGHPILNIKPIIKVENEELDKMEFTSCLQTPKLYSDDNPAFTLVKLPDCFPGKFYRDVEDDKNEDYILRDMQDGPIGNILVRKSGKIELMIKNTKYLLTSDGAGNAVNAAVLFPGKQSISMKPSLVTLGTVDETITFSPNWSCLFDRAKSNPKFL